MNHWIYNIWCSGKCCEEMWNRVRDQRMGDGVDAEDLSDKRPVSRQLKEAMGWVRHVGKVLASGGTVRRLEQRAGSRNQTGCWVDPMALGGLVEGLAPYSEWNGSPWRMWVQDPFRRIPLAAGWRGAGGKQGMPVGGGWENWKNFS